MVYWDQNKDGLPQDSEQRLNDVTVTLTGTDGAGHQVTQTATTDAGGIYWFNGLTTGTYSIQVTTPSGFNAGPSVVAGAFGGVAQPNLISQIAIPAGQSSGGYNFGEIKCEPPAPPPPPACEPPPPPPPVCEPPPPPVCPPPPPCDSRRRRATPPPPPPCDTPPPCPTPPPPCPPPPPPPVCEPPPSCPPSTPPACPPKPVCPPVRWHGSFNTCAPHNNGHVQHSWRRWC